ncbi:hypothetical protein DSCW_60310 [Desulfosarcina widdelii]|uniref:Uncharacterized protein n=1 Tax=Desulfosarcina widdelii TaxID=947919 RepID=A0A5K7ZK29_9BACT|nr:hypothetical protein [Desulfosarcina widdelii]BBO78614.1 hypothetical protein DSCW_60310 [Desulfosarcina widdelii]
MIVCQHKKSKKYFIVVKDDGSPNKTFITPEGNIRTGIDINFFQEEFEVGNNLPMPNQYINEKQLKSYVFYNCCINEEPIEKYEILIDEMTDGERRILINQLKHKLGKK